jgi:hypothetical protein
VPQLSATVFVASQVGRAVILAVGGAEGVTASDASDDGPTPTALAAVTVKVYGVPLARLPTAQESAPVVAQVPPPGSAVTA